MHDGYETNSARLEFTVFIEEAEYTVSATTEEETIDTEEEELLGTSLEVSDSVTKEK